MQPSRYLYLEECNTCSGHGKVELPCSWTVDPTDRTWSRTYTDYADVYCDYCNGSGSIPRYE